MLGKSTWASTLDANLTERVSSIIQTIAQRLNDDTLLQAGSTIDSNAPSQYYWSNIDHTNLALLFAMLGRQSPGLGYDAIAHKHLLVAVRNNRVIPSIALFGGLSQIGIAAHILSSGASKYSSLLATIDGVINTEARTFAAQVAEANRQNALASSNYDLIGGLTGVAVYLVSRTQSGVYQSSIDQVLSTLISLTEIDSKGVFHLKTNKGQIVGSLAERESLQYGLMNCGLAHGIAGVLAVLSLAHAANITLPGLREAIEKLAAWLIAQCGVDQSGPFWPDVVALDEHGSYNPAVSSGMDAWCYGTLGISRAIWLAGRATDNLKWQNLAADAVSAAFTRLRESPRPMSPTICHGVAGALLLAVRFWNDTNEDRFRVALEDCLQQLLAHYDTKNVFGFRDLERYVDMVDNPGFLTGACGIALVLLAVSSDIEPVWDRTLLLS